MEVGYDAVGMRDIARAVGKQPPQLYRLQLTKSDILAEIIIELNQEQIDVLPVLLATVEGGNAFERTCSYLVGLYASDIAYKPIRSIGAAFGWTWQAPYEDSVIAQVMQLLAPVADWLRRDGFDEIESRCYGIWSLYYVGYRRAVMRSASARECLDEILGPLRLLFQKNAYTK